MTDRAIQLNEIDIGKIGLTPELGDNLKALKLIRTLLQSQPKPRITRGEIEEWLEEKWNEDWCDELYFNDILDWLVDLFKSKGFEVVKK